MPFKQFVPTPAGTIPVERLCGWAGRPASKGGNPELFRQEFDLWSADLPRLVVKGSAPTAGQRCMIWELGRKILGCDPPNIAQSIGDCGAFATKNAIQNAQFYPIAHGQRDVWTAVYPPYLYACARVLVGKRQLGWADGSLGLWQAKAAEQYGAVPLHGTGLNVPDYSGEVARQWGYDGPPGELVEVGKQHLTRSTALVRTWEDLRDSVCNYYPVIVASAVGFDMIARQDGFMHAGPDWGHVTCCIGLDDDPVDPYAALLNTWGPDVHGKIIDFKTGEPWPAGTIRTRKANLVRMLSEGDSFAISPFARGFPAQALSADIADLW